jgi:hypothetical protein
LGQPLSFNSLPPGLLLSAITERWVFWSIRTCEVYGYATFTGAHFLLSGGFPLPDSRETRID